MFFEDVTARASPDDPVGIYTRLSKDWDGTQTATARQEADCRDLCARLGLEPVAVYEAIDLSGFRPEVSWAGYECMLADLEPTHASLAISNAGPRPGRKPPGAGLTSVRRRPSRHIGNADVGGPLAHLNRLLARVLHRADDGHTRGAGLGEHEPQRVGDPALELTVGALGGHGGDLIDHRQLVIAIEHVQGGGTFADTRSARGS